MKTSVDTNMKNRKENIELLHHLFYAAIKISHLLAIETMYDF